MAYNTQAFKNTQMSGPVSGVTPSGHPLAAPVGGGAALSLPKPASPSLQAQNSTLNFTGATGQPNASAFTGGQPNAGAFTPGTPFFTGPAVQGQGVTPSTSQFVPLTNMYQGQNPSDPAENAIGQKAGYIGSITSQPTQNLGAVADPTFNWELSKIQPFVDAIRGNVAAAQGDVGAQSGTVTNNIVANAVPGFVTGALNQASSQNAFQRALAAAAAQAAMQRNLYAAPQGQPQNNAPGVSISGSPNIPQANLPPSNGTQFAPPLPGGQPQALPPQTPPPTPPSSANGVPASAPPGTVLGSDGNLYGANGQLVASNTSNGAFVPPGGYIGMDGNIYSANGTLYASSMNNDPNNQQPNGGFTSDIISTTPGQDALTQGMPTVTDPNSYLNFPNIPSPTGNLLNVLDGGNAGDPNLSGLGGLDLSGLSAGFTAAQPQPVNTQNAILVNGGGGFDSGLNGLAAFNTGLSASDLLPQSSGTDLSGPSYLPSGVNVSSLPGYGNNPVVSVGGNPMDSLPTWWSSNLT